MYETDGAIMPFRPFTADPYQRPPRWPLLRNRPRALRHAASCHMPSLSLVENMDGGSFSQLFGYLGSWPVGLCRAPPMCSAGDTLDLLCRRAFPRVDAPSVPFRTVKTKNLLAASQTSQFHVTVLSFTFDFYPIFAWSTLTHSQPRYSSD